MLQEKPVGCLLILYSISYYSNRELQLPTELVSNARPELSKLLIYYILPAFVLRGVLEATGFLYPSFRSAGGQAPYCS